MFKEDLDSEIAKLQQQVAKLTEQRERDAKEIESLKAHKKEQSMQKAKQAKDHMMKHKQLEKSHQTRLLLLQGFHIIIINRVVTNSE